MVVLPESLLYIDGNIRKASDGETYDLIGPWTGEVVGCAANATIADADAAIAAARRAFDTTDWSSQHEYRFTLVKKLRALIDKNRERLARSIRFEAGATLGAIKGAQLNFPIANMDCLIAAFPEVRWEENRGRANFRNRLSDRVVVYEPIGVAAAITPWNVPLAVNLGKVIAALLAGCTVILKPAPNTPGVGFILGELAAEAGFPPGVFNVLTSQDPVAVGEMLTTDARVDVVSFTGSTAVGKRIMEIGSRTMKRVFLELGGKSANIVLDDAPDFARAIAQSMVLFHAGQGCGIPTRLLVSRRRYDEAIAILQKSYEAFGDNWGVFDAPEQIMGPVSSKKQFDRVMGYIHQGQKEDARLLAGGRARSDKGSGYFIEPTCFVDAKSEMRIAQEEIFGPVLVVIPYEDEEDAIRIANDSEFGLSGMVHSKDVMRAMQIARRIRTGSVSINNGACIAGDLPFGGRKGSGMGREWGREGIEEYLESKTIAVGVPAA